MVNRCAIHHGGMVFDNGGEALVVELNGRPRRGAPWPLALRLNAGLGLIRPERTETLDEFLAEWKNQFQKFAWRCHIENFWR